MKLFDKFCRQRYWLRLSRNLSTLKWPSQLVRKTFIDYYQSLGCKFIKSSPVLPKDDANLLFVNAGMNQFKWIFLQSTDDSENEFSNSVKKFPGSLAVNSQKCIRASGKHNDLRDVGRDSYHHTFFEMLGNWSFRGHLDKARACKQAWSLLVDVYKLPKDRLSVSYFAGDQKLNLEPALDTRDIWLDIGVPKESVIAKNVDENFWEMANTGPCGPCTEIHYLVNENFTVELWNLVFIEYCKLTDGSLTKLPNMHVDTGMGLERLCAVLQNVDSNYDTDLFRPIINEVERRSPSNLKYQSKYGSEDPDGINAAFRIISDHIRMLTIALSDGIAPAGKGVGHVVRRVLHNAVHNCALLKLPEGVLPDLVKIVTDALGPAYPELADSANYVSGVIRDEESRFLSQMVKAKAKFALLLKNSKGNLTPAQLFHMYSFYGLSEEIIANMARNANVNFSAELFEIERQKAIEKSKSNKVKSSRQYKEPLVQ